MRRLFISGVLKFAHFFLPKYKYKEGLSKIKQIKHRFLKRIYYICPNTLKRIE